MVTVEADSEQLRTPEIPPKREGRCRRPSSVVTSADASDQSRWSFPVSQYRQSAIIEMGQAYPLEISHLNDPQEVRIPHYNVNNRNSIASISSTLPLPLKEPLPFKQSLPYKEPFPFNVPQPYGGSSSYNETTPYKEPSHKESSSYRESTPFKENSSYNESSPYRDPFTSAQFTKPTSSSAQRGPSPPYLPPKTQFTKPIPSNSLSDAYVSAQESIEDLHEAYGLSSVPPLSDLRSGNQPKPSPSRSLDVSGLSNRSSSSLYENEPPQKDADREDDSVNKRRSQTLKKLQQIIADDDVADASYITAADTPKHRPAFIHSPELPKAINDDFLLAGTSGLRISNPDSANTSASKPHQEDHSARSSNRRKESDTIAPHVALQGDSAVVDNKPSSYSQAVASSQLSSQNLKETPFLSPGPPTSLATATSTVTRPKPSTTRRKHSSHSKRNFTKKSLEDMMQTNPSPYDIGDIGLPKPERVLLEKFIDSLSRLSIEVQMDEGKREEGRRRLNNALRALEGWF